MKVYRAVAFRKLAFMLNANGRMLWNHAGHEFRSMYPEERKANWWCDDKFSTFRKQIAGIVAKECREEFFDKSLEFNAMRGGRFNPARSFGVLYTASNPTVGALEVLFHQFEQAFSLYKTVSKSGDAFEENFNHLVPDEQELVIVAFEIDYRSEAKEEVFCDLEQAKKLARQVGFKRYVGDEFSRHFLFGNDYEIARIVGMLHAC